MNKRTYSALTCFMVCLTFNTGIAQIKVISNGNVGINKSLPAYKLDVDGDSRFTGPVRFSNWTNLLMDWSGGCGSPVLYPSTSWYFQLGKSNRRIGNLYTSGIHTTVLYYDSDDSIKTNVTAIASPITTIRSLQGKEYYFRSSFLESMPDSSGGRPHYAVKQYGFMARELMQVLPDAVSYDPESGRYSVNYISVIPILSEAVKAQQGMIDEMKNISVMQEVTINNLTSQVSMLQAMIENLQISLIQLQRCCDVNMGMQANPAGKEEDTKQFKKEDETKLPVLYQNNPNPFHAKTEMRYTLPAQASSVHLIISNLNGQQVLSFKNINSGKGTHTVSVSGEELGAGSYYYTLLVDGKEISTKKMILVK